MKDFNRLVVIADDLTGAMDVNSSALSSGLKPVTFIVNDLQKGNHPSLETLGKEFRANEITVLATNTRYLDDRTIEATLSDILSSLNFSMNSDLLFLKLDSTARGNLGAFMKGLLNLGFKGVVYTPAYPSLGRTVEAGLLYIYGEKLEDTHFATDTFSPRHTSSLRDIISLGGFSFDIYQVDIKDLRKGKVNLFSELILEHQVIVSDALNHEDLDQIASMAIYANRLLGGVALAGSSALFKSVLKVTGLQREAKILFIMGSLNPKTKRQVEVWGSEGYPVFQLNPSESLELFLERLTNVDRSLVIYSGDTPNPGMEIQIAKGLSLLTRELILRVKWDALMLCGGEVAWWSLRELNLPSLKPILFLEPGIPILEVKGSSLRYLITKPGGFGSDEILVRTQAIISSLLASTSES